jgi:hypothetical protein
MFEMGLKKFRDLHENIKENFYFNISVLEAERRKLDREFYGETINGDNVDYVLNPRYSWVEE